MSATLNGCHMAVDVASWFTRKHCGSTSESPRKKPEATQSQAIVKEPNDWRWFKMHHPAISLGKVCKNSTEGKPQTKENRPFLLRHLNESYSSTNHATPFTIRAEKTHFNEMNPQLGWQILNESHFKNNLCLQNVRNIPKYLSQMSIRCKRASVA